LKVDKANHARVLANTEFTVFRNDGSVAEDIHGNHCIGLTDESGTLSWEIPYDKEGYYVQETKAPAGYRIDPSRYEVQLENKETIAEVVHVTVADEKTPDTPDTGDHSGPGNNAVVFGCSVLSALALLHKRLKL